jgi:hypothetical protein
MFRDVGQGALNKTWKAANRFVQKQNSTVGAIPTGSGSFSFADLVRLWTSVNGGLGDPRLMARIALAESGGDPNAYNPSGASGLWQILGAMVPGNLFNPKVNALNAAAKLRAQGLGAWAASGPWQRGGVIPAFHRGGIVGDRNEQVVRARTGEGVFTPGQMKAMGGPSKIEFHVHGDGAAAALATVDDVYAIVDGHRVEVDGFNRQRDRMRRE